MLSDTPSSDTHPHFLRGNGDKAHIHVPANAASQEDLWLSFLLSFALFIPEKDRSVVPKPSGPDVAASFVHAVQRNKMNRGHHSESEL